MSGSSEMPTSAPFTNRKVASAKTCAIDAAARCGSRPGAYGCWHTLRLMRAAFAGPGCVIASISAAYETESMPVPMWLVCRPGHMFWMTRLLAPDSAEVGWGPLVGWTVSSVSDRTVVHAVGPGVGSRPGRLIARKRLDPAPCCQTAAGNLHRGVHPARSDPNVVVPCWVPATRTASETIRRSDGQ